MDDEVAQMVVTNPPYNVKIGGHVMGNGAIQHDEFAMAAGEMNKGEFTDFLSTFMAHVNEYSQDGAIIFSFMNWPIKLKSSMQPNPYPSLTTCDR